MWVGKTIFFFRKLNLYIYRGVIFYNFIRGRLTHNCVFGHSRADCDKIFKYPYRILTTVLKILKYTYLIKFLFYLVQFI